MTDNYAKIVQNNLNRLYTNLPKDLAKNLPGEQVGNHFIIDAFGEKCVIKPESISLGDEEHSSVFGILITLYTLNVCSDICVLSPFKSFKEFPESMPYVGAFTKYTEHVLVSFVPRIKEMVQEISRKFKGGEAPLQTGGDFSFIVYPLPKIALCYIFYEADDDFSASVTCLFSNNANRFMPIDGLADVGEYTSRKIIDLIY